MQNQSNSYAEDEDMAGEEIVQRLDGFELFTTVEDNIRNKKAVLDSSKKYTINKSFDFCPHHYLYNGSGSYLDEDCDEKTKICKCQILEGKDDKSVAVEESKIKLGKLIKYYKDDRVECVNIDGNHQSCFLFQDEDGKFAYIIPFKYNLKPTNDSADLQKESFITKVDSGSFIEVYFSDEEGICNNAKEKFDKKTKETYLDCTVEQRKKK